MADTITVSTEAGWDELRARGLTLVVDPMIFRTGEVFLRGAAGAAREPRELWRAISANVGSLAAFIDAIVLNDRVPIFDYKSTWPDRNEEMLADDAKLVDFCNRDEEVLVPVTVDYVPYWEVKQEALKELGSPGEIPRQDADGIVEELSAFDWEWQPHLPGWEESEPNEQTVATFLYGGLLFGGYAQRVGGQHLIQPKRSRLFASAALRESVADDETLFRRLEQLPGEVPEDVEDAVAFPSLPSFLPYLLLAEPESPAQLIRRALQLRGSPAVAEYRDWRRELDHKLAIGQRAPAQQHEVKQLWDHLARELGPRGGNVKFTWSVEAVFLTIPVPKVGIQGDVEPGRLYAWALRSLPGHRYQKLMLRMMAAHEEYVRVDRHLRRLWNDPA